MAGGSARGVRVAAGGYEGGRSTRSASTGGVTGSGVPPVEPTTRASSAPGRRLSGSGVGAKEGGREDTVGSHSDGGQVVWVEEAEGVGVAEAVSSGVASDCAVPVSPWVVVAAGSGTVRSAPVPSV